MGLLRRLRWLWQGVVWEVAEVMGREERAGYQEDSWFAEVLAADPRRSEPRVTGGRHRCEGVADHSRAPERRYSRRDEHVGHHRLWYDASAHLAPWRGAWISKDL